MKIKIRHAFTSVSNNVSILRNVSISSVNVVKVHKEIKNKRYIVRHEDWKVFDEITPMVSAYSIIDGSYIGDLKTAQRLDDLGIWPEKAEPSHNVASIGLSDLDGKHYGFSHRACWGFQPGDSVQKGDCAYLPLPNKQSILESVKQFWDSPDQIVKLDGNNIVRHSPNYALLRKKYGDEFFYKWKDKDWIKHFGHINKRQIFKQLKDEGYMHSYPQPISSIKTGRGEWTARTLSDARQMAKDFAQSVG